MYFTCMMVMQTKGTQEKRTRTSSLVLGSSASAAGEAQSGAPESTPADSLDAAVSSTLEAKLEWFEQRLTRLLDNALDRFNHRLDSMLQKKLATLNLVQDNVISGGCP